MRKAKNLLVIFDETEGIPEEHWLNWEALAAQIPHQIFLSPTQTQTQIAYQAEMQSREDKLRTLLHDHYPC